MHDVTITRVDLTSDLREATVWFTPLGGIGDDARVKELQAGLRKAASFLQGRAGRALRLRNTPRLTFRYDTGVENLVHIHELLHEMPKDAAPADEATEDGDADG